QRQFQSDRWGRGRFYEEKIPPPACLKHIPRYFRRFGRPRRTFQQFLAKEQPFDFVFIQTMMTYWYPGIREVIEDVRSAWPKAKIILGGNYVTLCTTHAEKSGADFLVKGENLTPLWKFMQVEPDLNQPPLWEAYEKLNTAVLKLTEGCPFTCTYCSVPMVYNKFRTRPLKRSLAELELLCKLGVKNIAFYDDALLFEAAAVFIPFLNEVLRRKIKINFHTPNALNARFINKDLARLMVRAGFKTFYLGFESASSDWQDQTGSKVFPAELACAAKHLTAAGAEAASITAYQILGHPQLETQQLEASMRLVNSLGIRGTLADFSPIPGTPDGESCRKWVDMDEPLMHNKTAFPIILLGFDETNRLKDLQRQLNKALA
ncbi:MAG: B12-binding domain-containing radical SAM protein, partial [Planctomycetota bacterium]